MAGRTLTKLPRGDEVWHREGIQRLLVDDVKDHVGAVPQRDVAGQLEAP